VAEKVSDPSSSNVENKEEKKKKEKLTVADGNGEGT
jgi:hypothetical protein